MVQTWLKKYVYLRVASEKEIKMHPKKAEKAALSKKIIMNFINSL